VTPLPTLIGMVHLGPLPGAPRYENDLDRIIDRAVTDSRVLAEAGFEGLMIENFGDAPFFATEVPKVTIAAMARVITEIARASSVPFGVNVLRNDAGAALAIAAATGASFIRVNVLSGTMFTDQGTIEGRAAELARMRANLAPEVSIFADVHVKHATPPSGLTITDAATDLWERSGADAVVVSGSGTGSPAAVTDIQAVRDAVPDAPLFLGSGVDVDQVAEIRGLVDGVIVGSSLKIGNIDQPIDASLAARFVTTWTG